MPQYAGYSVEVSKKVRRLFLVSNPFSQELRVQDYAQGRKTATTTTGVFGQPTAFGATQQTNTGLFGAQTAQPTAPLFGSTTTTNTTNPTPAFGAFGQPLNQPTATNNGNLFGSSAFGQPQQQQQQQPQQQQSVFGGGGTFGQPPQQQTNAFGGGTSVFGNNAPKPAFTPFGGGTYLFFTLNSTLRL
jgi:nuclear pore complex protein Nup98-Nup96